MGDEKDSSGLIIGLIIGAFIAFVLLSRRTQTLSAQHTQPVQQQTPQYNWQPMDIPRVDDIKPQTIQLPQQDQKLIDMVYQLQKTSSQLEQTTHKLQELQETVSELKTSSQLEQTHKLQELQETVSKLRQDGMSQPQQIIIQQPTIPQSTYQPPHVTVQPVQPINVDKIQPQITRPIEQQIYKNNEKWQIVRGKDGRIKSLEIVRDVKKSG